jgi:hypothetical protein
MASDGMLSSGEKQLVVSRGSSTTIRAKTSSISSVSIIVIISIGFSMLGLSLVKESNADGVPLES